VVDVVPSEKFVSGKSQRRDQGESIKNSPPKKNLKEETKERIVSLLNSKIVRLIPPWCEVVWASLN
jgi:hypothetical protein